MDTPNLDALDEDDLLALAKYYRQLADYALNKANAMTSRKHGAINYALSLEAKCERIYKSLPEDSRW